MFEALFSDNKLAEIEFTDPEKFRSIPSLSLPAVCTLDEHLTKDMRVFEWGSGASTLFFAHRCAQVVSIEHDRAWFEKVGEAVEYRGLPVDRSLVEPDERFYPDYASYQPGYESVSFMQYARAIDRFMDESFDLILVDGRARCACLDRAQRKLKVGGMLMLDDSLRSIYSWAMAKIEWPVMHLEGCIPFYRHGHTVRTTLWVKE